VPNSLLEIGGFARDTTGTVMSSDNGLARCINGRHASTGHSMLRRASVVLAHRPASKRLQRRPVALRATFKAHGPMQIVSRAVPRVSMAKIGVIALPLPAPAAPSP
jgi:hypothetical protein